MKRILVIDDDHQVRALLVEILTHEGYEVIAAGNGVEGLNRFRENPADAVITDLIMPEKEGFETIFTLRREFPKVGVIAISGGGRVGAADYLPIAKMLGARFIIAKPFTSGEILDAVRAVLSGAQ
jgi:hypothetical protein